MFKRILLELEHHAPFTIFGAITGIILMILFKDLPDSVSYKVFYTFHPLHVLLSALVTASMYNLHRWSGLRSRANFIVLFVIGYVGSVGIATISDSLIPYLGEYLLDMPKREAHIGFIEEWWLVNPLAILGIIIAYIYPRTKVPHAGHVLLSTWASLFHIMMAKGEDLTLGIYLTVFVFLFVAVWLPCCLSDIVFPLLFVRDKD